MLEKDIEEKVGNKINDNVLESFHFSGTFFGSVVLCLMKFFGKNTIDSHML